MSPKIISKAQDVSVYEETNQATEILNHEDLQDNQQPDLIIQQVPSANNIIVRDHRIPSHREDPEDFHGLETEITDHEKIAARNSIRRSVVSKDKFNMS